MSSRTCRRPVLAPIRITAAAVAVLGLAGCAAASVENEERLVEVHGDRVYLCLADAINASEPPSCGADIGTSDNPQLHGRMVPELVSLLGGTNTSVRVTAREEDGRWFLQGYEAPS